VFDVTPKKGQRERRFLAAVWVEDLDYNIVASQRHLRAAAAQFFFFHMDTFGA